MRFCPGQKQTGAIAMALGLSFFFVFPWVAANATSCEPSFALLARNDESSQEVGPDFDVLKGRWRRPDGGYVIEIRNIESTGRIDAAYLNPNPIRVSKAEATRESTTIKAFIELRDTGYPGSTYTLIYAPQTDQLRGVYFQAAVQQNYDVVFYRIK
jgi:hypothetical protein